MLATGVSVPFGDEYRARQMNEPLMQTLLRINRQVVNRGCWSNRLPVIRLMKS